MATYVGPSVSPVFVTGVINDAWDMAATLSAQASAAKSAADVAQAVAPLAVFHIDPPSDLNMVIPPMQPFNGGAAAGLQSELASMLSSFMLTYYPPAEIPDAAAAWARVLASFDRTTHVALRVYHDNTMLPRITAPWAARGMELDDDVLEALNDRHARRVAAIEAQQDRNVRLADATHRRDVELTGYELVMRLQLDAMEAARTFLVGAVLAVQSQQAREQAALAGMKQQLQGAYMAALRARIEANEREFDRLLLQKRTQLESHLPQEERRVFAFRELASMIVDEIGSIASQAAAAINRVGASASINASERTP